MLTLNARAVDSSNNASSPAVLTLTVRAVADVTLPAFAHAQGNERVIDIFRPDKVVYPIALPAFTAAMRPSGRRNLCSGEVEGEVATVAWIGYHTPTVVNIAGLDLVVESVPERLALKQQVLAECLRRRAATPGSLPRRFPAKGEALMPTPRRYANQAERQAAYRARQG